MRHAAVVLVLVGFVLLWIMMHTDTNYHAGQLHLLYATDINMNTPLPSPTTFDWNLLDTTTIPDCGGRKCFFPSRQYNTMSDTTTDNPISKNNSNHKKKKDEKNKIGYLVARECAAGGENYYDIMNRVYGIAKRIEKNTSKDGIVFRHFELEPAIRVPPPPLSLSAVNNIDYHLVPIARIKIKGRKNNNALTNGTCNSNNAVIQKVHAAPTPHLIPKCKIRFTHGNQFWDKDSSGESKRQEFRTAVLMHNNNNTTTNTTTTMNANSEKGTSIFLQTLKTEMEQLQKLLKHEPGLWRDFQILVDTKGQIYHIDLDRIMTTSTRIKTFHDISQEQRCFDTIIKNFERILSG